MPFFKELCEVDTGFFPDNELKPILLDKHCPIR